MPSTAAKRRNSKKTSVAKQSPPLISPASLRRLRQVSLLGLALGSTYLVVAMTTYSPMDPAFSHTGAGPVVNAAGPAGAWLADVVFQILGYGAWSLSTLVLIFTLKMAGRSLGGWMTGLAAVIALWSSLTGIALLAPGTDASPFPPGGYIGLLSMETLNAVIGPAGSWILVLFCLLGAAPFVLGIDWEKVLGGAIHVVESRVPALRHSMTSIMGTILERLRYSGGETLQGMRSAVMSSLPERIPQRTTGHPVHEEIPGGVPVSIGGPTEPTIGSLGTPTFDQAEQFQDVDNGIIHVPDAEEEPADKTVFQLPELVEVEWGTEAGIDMEGEQECSASGSPEEANAEPISLDAALLAAAGNAPDPGFRGSSVDLPAEPLWSATAEAIQGDETADEPGLETDPENAPTLPPTDEPVWDAPKARPRPVSSADLSASVRASGSIEVTPGSLESGGVQDDGRAIVVPEIRTPFELPHLDLLENHPRDVASFDEDALRELAGTLELKLADFGVKGEVVAIRPGPVITTFEYLPAPGIKVSKIAGLQDDIAMALKALRVRIIAPIPGKGVVGIEIPNTNRLTVWIRDMIASGSFRENTGALPMALGKTVDGKPRVADLAKMPHLLVGGTTGSGKSVGVNAMLLSLLYTRTPEELRMILVDPKMLEFEMYRDIPHLLHPVVTDPKLASAALKWACTEMDHRYRVLSQWKVRNIANYNAKLEKEMEDWTPEKARKYAPADWPEGQPPPPPKRMPYLVIVIDELADLMMVAAKDVEESIIRIAQKARAAGIHLIVATQRPSVNVITGLIKANMPSRIAFQVRTKIDGRTILDQNGAEALLGQGDMLFLPPGVSALERLHGAFVSDDEVNAVTDFARAQGAPNYEAEIKADDGAGRSINEDEYDELYDQAVAFVVESGKASSSMIQRRFKIGYNRAARIIEVMEQEGVIGAADGARPREILVGRTG